MNLFAAPLWPDHIAGHTTHARRGSIRNAFRYGVDYVLIDPESDAGPGLFSRNRFNLASVDDRNHGGPVGAGRGLPWAQEVFARAGLNLEGLRILLLTQPSFLWYTFNPVSFWLAMEGEDLRAVIAEVSNTFGDRHSYLCHRDGFAPISGPDEITARKIFHVSPFQKIAGEYRFHFDIRTDRIAIRIALEDGADGVIATLAGRRQPLSNASLLRASLRRPLGAFRTIALIHWQALKLKLKGAPYRRRPLPPKQEVS
ncbi:DUF1365 domain-containing protein [Phaeobacter sp. PT47_59]|uniref:DUF1365 domain-containing protein n=1 Tax=Phaeobacter sp. PT47_59 TaxID=3029979 RepID=UPI0023803B34|nr:DUF1365 domain-containing protein [Phaeobacter sp. PT47_59]MDE4173394.1 DUF1365 domain-containing protein [Phaeobacter sp. PT47_59]